MRIVMAQRILWLKVFTLLALGALGGRLVQLQIVQGPALTEAAIRQRHQVLPLQMQRGAILDRSGVALTDPQSYFGLAIFPALRPPVGELAPILDAPTVAALTAQVTDRQPPFWVKAGGGSGPLWRPLKLSLTEADAIRALGLPGALVGTTGYRYGTDSLARHLVGFASDKGGQAGLEAIFEAELAGDRVVSLTLPIDGRGRPAGSKAVRPWLLGVGKEPFDLVTTLDARVQRAVEAVLDNTTHPSGGILRAAVVVMEPLSGEVRAIASRPQFDQATLAGSGPKPQLDRALTAYEVGSLFKPLLTAAALDEGLISPGDPVTCGGTYKLAELTIPDRFAAPRTLPFAEAMARSCNIPFINLGYERLGKEGLLATARRFGLGSPTGALPGLEPAGNVPALQYGGDLVQLSFGQAGLMATPLQIARAYSAIAADGVLPPVRVVAAVQAGPERRELPAGGRPVRVMKVETARTLQQLLLGVTAPKGVGTGQNAWVEGVGAAGKTGSAETVQDGKAITHAWFAGWVPSQKPAYVIAVLIEDGKEGGTYAAPLFRRIAAAIHGL